MKRSDAVHLLKEIVLTHLNCGPDCCETDPIMYSRMLFEIENTIGMLPPFSNEVFQKNARIYVDPSGREWEPE